MNSAAVPSQEDLLQWFSQEVERYGPAEVQRQIDEVARRLDLQTVSLNTVSNWSRGEVTTLQKRSLHLLSVCRSEAALRTFRQHASHLSEADLDLIVEQYMQTAPPPKVSKCLEIGVRRLKDVEQLETLVNTYIHIAPLHKVANFLSTVVARLAAPLDCKVSMIVRDEFIRQGLSIHTPDHLERFTEIAEAAWQEPHNADLLRRLLSGDVKDNELTDVDLALVAACLARFSKNPGYTKQYLELQIASAQIRVPPTC